MEKMNTIVDVGAVGVTINPKNTYHLFEIRDDLLEKESTEGNVTTHNVGLYSENTTLPLYITKKGQCTSLYEPDLEVIKSQGTNPDRFSVVETINVDVVRMDSILPADMKIDYLKIDTQGSELDILKGAGDLLHNVTKIECEVEFVPLYKNQPLFQDVKDYLSQFGFEHIGFTREVSWDGKNVAFADAIFLKFDLDKSK